MSIIAQMIAEIRALGLRCVVFGPEAWLAITVHSEEDVKRW